MLLTRFARKKQKTPNGGWLLLLAAMSIAPALIASARAGVLEDVREQFNKDKGVPRLVVLVSPT